MMKSILERLLMKSLCFIPVSLLTLWASLAWASGYYCPADSTFYRSAGYPSDDSSSIVRFRQNGMLAEQACIYAPGYVIGVDGAPGHVYTNTGHFSTDWGSTWMPGHNLPGLNDPIQPSIRAGLEPGQCFLVRHRDAQWLYFTNDSWQTCDSLEADSSLSTGEIVGVLSLSYLPNVVYGITAAGQICVSSDSGRTWTAGSALPIPYQRPLICGATDELWGLIFQTEVYLVTDTGRTVRDSLFVPHFPPDVPALFHASLETTPNPGELIAYYAATVWQGDYQTHILIYHLQDYGAQVDSAYYILHDYRMLDAGFPPPVVPLSFQLIAYPNPFNPSTTLSFSLPHASAVKLLVFDVMGRRLRTLADGRYDGGEHEILFDGSHLPSGTYYARLETGESVQVQTLVMVK
jgi:hypothetical protein